jgi:hypothetical protein
MYRNNFPTLTDASIQNGITYIDSVYPGIFTLFSALPQSAKVAKQTMLENVMVAWFLADTNPKAVSGIVANGFPVTSKTIGGTKGVSLTFRQVDVQPGMEFLNTNTFGNMAIKMFMGATERFGLFGNRGVGMSRGTGGGIGM